MTNAFIQYTQLGKWPKINSISKFNWTGTTNSSFGSVGSVGGIGHVGPVGIGNVTSMTGSNGQKSSNCTLAQTLPSLCTISAKHGFLLVPEHTDERRVRSLYTI